MLTNVKVTTIGSIIGLFLINFFLIQHIEAKTIDSFYELDKEVGRVSIANDFSIKILDNWAWLLGYYEPENLLGWHMNNGVGMHPNNFDNTSTILGFISKDGHFPIKNTSLKEYVKYKQQTPNLGELENSTNLVSISDLVISDEPAKKLEYDDKLREFKGVLYLTMFKGEPYLFLYEAYYPYYEQYISQFEEMVQSIIWLDTDKEVNKDENQTDIMLVMENVNSSNLNITKFELRGESFDQICPSHQCEIVKYTYTNFMPPTPSSMSIAYHIEFRYQDNMTNADIGPKKKEFLEQFSSSMFGCRVNDIIEDNGQEIYYCQDATNTLERVFDSRSWDYDSKGVYDAKKDTFTITGKFKGSS
jgi:hypothetical protein